MARNLRSNWFVIMIFLTVAIVIINELLPGRTARIKIASSPPADSAWVAPLLEVDNELKGKEREMVIYGEELIQHTSRYLGPKGSVRQVSNGMNCQNCHLDAGTRQWGNNYSAVYSTYPKFRARSNSIENIHKRVNDCFERSLNGSPLDTASYEMRSIVAYMKWLGKGIEKGRTPYSAGLPGLPYLDRAADTVKGRIVYNNYCQSCHGTNGEGVFNSNGSAFVYPPLWGPHSYNDGAGLYRLSRFASYVKSNMPFNQATHEHPVLSNEEAWDVAAFVNSQVRPHKDQSGDWMDITKKAIDEPFGPYSDTFSELQHKYGPYGPIKKAKESPDILRQGLAHRKPN